MCDRDCIYIIECLKDTVRRQNGLLNDTAAHRPMLADSFVSVTEDAANSINQANTFLHQITVHDVNRKMG